MNQLHPRLVDRVPGVVYEFHVALDGNWRFCYLSEGVRDLYECSPEAAYADHNALSKCILEEDRVSHRQAIERSTIHLEPWAHEYRITTPSGKMKWVRGHAIPGRNADGSVLWSGILTDISEIKAAEAKLIYIKKLYAAIIEVGRLIGRTSDLNVLFAGVCECAVKLGGMKMAWVGIPNETDRRMVAIARYGEGTDYLDEVFISVRDDLPEGRGPSGTSYREGRTIIIQNFQANPVTKPWTKYGKVYGWGSSATFAIPHDGRPYAAFSVYSAEIGAFDDEVVSLMEGLAADLSRAVAMNAYAIEREIREQILQDSQRRLKRAEKIAHVGNWSYEAATGKIIWSDEVWNIFGRDPQPVAPDYVTFTSWIREDFRTAHDDRTRRLLEMGPGEALEPFTFCLVRPDGEERWVEVFSETEFDEGGKPLQLFGVVSDITDRKHADTVLKVSEEKYRALVETTSTGYLILDKDGKVIDANNEYVRLTGYDELGNLLGRSVLDWTAEYEIERNAKAVAQCARDGFIRNLVIDYVDRHGRTTPIEINATVIGEGDSMQIISLCRDITERRQAENQIRQLAFHDELTKLPNRRLLDDRLNQAMAASMRRGCYGAVLFLDLDNFKPLNDRYGHKLGDMLLIEAADRLKGCVREMDTVARFGGDEFIVIATELAADKAYSIAQSTAIAEKIRLTLSEPYELTVRLDENPGLTVVHQCTVSIGVALFINREISQDDILKWADAAMYDAKAAGRNMIRFYDEKN